MAYSYSGRLIENNLGNVASRLAPIPVMLKVVHLLQAFLNGFFCTVVQSLARIQQTVCCRGPSALAELFMFLAAIIGASNMLLLCHMLFCLVNWTFYIVNYTVFECWHIVFTRLMFILRQCVLLFTMLFSTRNS